MRPDICPTREMVGGSAKSSGPQHGPGLPKPARLRKHLTQGRVRPKRRMSLPHVPLLAHVGACVKGPVTGVDGPSAWPGRKGEDVGLSQGNSVPSLRLGV